MESKCGWEWRGRPLWKYGIWYTGMKAYPYTQIHFSPSYVFVCCFSFKIYFEIVQEKCREFPHSLHTNSSVVSILPHLLHYLLLSFPGMTSLNSPVYISPKLHCTIQYFRQGNQHWYSTITQSIDLIQMMPAIPTMSLFPFWSRILAGTCCSSGTVSYPNSHVPDSLKEHNSFFIFN